VNTTGEEKRVPLSGERQGIISHRVFEGLLLLGPQEADLIQ
jgi:hypothetical protein